MKAPFAKKSLGQNFLVDKNAIAKIVDSVPEHTPLLLEIGPGRGALSCELFRRAEKFCVLEKDDIFAANIGETLRVNGCADPLVFHADALEFDWERVWTESGSVPDTPLVIAANLPYNVATEILFRLLKLRERIPRMTLMFQKEVAERIAAREGTKAYGAISVAMRNFYEVRVQQILKPGAFRPSPKVDSAVLEFERLRENRAGMRSDEEFERFHRFVKACFAHRRKTLENSLAMELPRTPWSAIAGKNTLRELLLEAKLKETVRAESLSIESFAALFRLLERRLK